MNDQLHVIQWLAGLVILAESLNKLERTTPCGRGGNLRARVATALKALAWALLALGAAGTVFTPMLQLLGVTLSSGIRATLDTCVLAGFAALIIRTRVKEG